MLGVMMLTGRILYMAIELSNIMDIYYIILWFAYGVLLNLISERYQPIANNPTDFTIIHSCWQLSH